MTYTATLPDVYSWESQVRQYPTLGTPGIGYFAGLIPDVGTVDCLLYRNPDGRIVGILNHYGFDMPPWEVTGNVNLWVRKDWQRRGIGSALWQEAKRRWNVTLDGQRFTVEGAAFANRLHVEGTA